MGISLGGGKLNRAMLGDQKIKAIMLGAQKIWSGMGKKYVYAVHQKYGTLPGPGYIDVIDADTMKLIAIWNKGDVFVKKAVSSYNNYVSYLFFVQNNYDDYGGTYYTTGDRDGSGYWKYRFVRIDQNANIMSSANTDFTSINKRTLDAFTTNGKYIDQYSTSDFGLTYTYKAGYKFAYYPQGPAVETANYIVSSSFAMMGGGEDPTYFDFFHMYTFEKSTKKSYSFTARSVTVAAHETLIDHFYTLTLDTSNEHYVRLSNVLELRNIRGVIIASVVLPSPPSQVRVFEKHLFVACTNLAICKIGADLSYLQILCYGGVGFLDEDFYLTYGAFEVHKVSYSGAILGTTTLDASHYSAHPTYGDTKCSVSGVMCSHPIIEI